MKSYQYPAFGFGGIADTMTHMTSAAFYIGGGILVFGALLQLFRKTGVGLTGFFSLWFHGELTFLSVPLWPITAVLSLLLWVCAYYDLRRERNEMKKREEQARNGADRYAHLSMDELLAEQKRVLSANGRSKIKCTIRLAPLGEVNAATPRNAHI